MPVFTVFWKSEMDNWAKIEADSKEDALQAVKDGLHDDVDCDESSKPHYGYHVEEGTHGQGRITKIN